jgi:transglutaminase-like putative cysteine protease
LVLAMTRLEVRHSTTYSYRRDVGFGEHRILFRPRDSQDQRLLDFQLDIRPAPSDLHWIHDAFNNCVAVATFETGGRELRFDSRIVLDHAPLEGLRFRATTDQRSWPLVYDAETLPDLEACIRRRHPDAGEIEAWAQQFVRAGRRTDLAHLLGKMTTAIQQDFIYSRRIERGTKLPTETLASRTGTCRDFALLMMEAARSLGLAARFVTGYIYVPSRDGEENRGGGATHAWVQVFLPGAGWVEFDPTNGIVGNRDLIRVGVARDPQQALPLHGTYRGKAADFIGMSVDVDVAKIGADSPADSFPLPVDS